ncbi:hypothetical protein JAAARDRAFT_531614 [Jaapia argillacea MUCL 33604]|uniref:F-box domain-containing protein n=1 Tax=Jaapia argillacea MUCL 33604 TaxID=933084 RepID=A0A067PLI5_9AGAM|nr:hypothetical protein JAAARDRAFT_531614 [Jaapia argillacea MUCL 33604]
MPSSKQPSSLNDHASKDPLLESPIRKVPAEVLSKIFVDSLPDDKFMSPDANATPLLVTQINSRWREVALRTPSLWCSFDWKVSHTRDIYMAQSFTVQRWLQRSGGRPLSLRLIASEHHPSTDYGPCSPEHCLQMVMPYAQRWKILELYLPAHWCSCLQYLDSMGTPLLESIKIQALPEGANPAFLAKAPRLSHVDLRFPFTTHSTILPWAQLTSLHFGVGFPGLVTTECLQKLQECTSLLHCTLIGIAQVDPSMDSPVTLPKLQSLFLHAAVDVALLLDSLLLPKLEQLRLSYPSGVDPSPSRPIISLIERSSCVIKHLRLSTQFSSDEGLLDVLRNTPLLETLKVADEDLVLSAHFMERLTIHPVIGDDPSDHASHMLPNLRYLYLKGNVTSSAVELAQMVRSRWNTTRLEEVHITSSSISEALESSLKLDDCIDAGLIFVVE